MFQKIQWGSRDFIDFHGCSSVFQGGLLGTFKGFPVCLRAFQRVLGRLGGFGGPRISGVFSGLLTKD